MVYTFEILGVASVLDFFNHQTSRASTPDHRVEYLGSYRCTLDALIESVETVAPHQGWNLDQAVDTVMNFWFNNGDRIGHWKRRLDDADAQTLLVSRLANYQSLRTEFERILTADSGN